MFADECSSQKDGSLIDVNIKLTSNVFLFGHHMSASGPVLRSSMPPKASSSAVAAVAALGLDPGVAALDAGLAAKDPNRATASRAKRARGVYELELIH